MIMTVCRITGNKMSLISDNTFLSDIREDSQEIHNEIMLLQRFQPFGVIFHIMEMIFLKNIIYWILLKTIEMILINSQFDINDI